MSLHERHLPINLPLHDFSFPNQLHSIHNPNLCCCIHLLSIFKRCCNWLLAQHMFPSGNGQQGLLLETWSKQCSMLIEWSMDIISNCNTTVQVLKEQSPVLVKGCDGANVNNINIWVFYEVFVTGSSFGNAMTFCKPEASNHSYFTLAKGHLLCFQDVEAYPFLTGMARQLHEIYHHGSRFACCVFLVLSQIATSISLISPVFASLKPCSTKFGLYD